MKTTPAAVLRLAQAIPETAENFPILRELIATLQELVAIAAVKEPQP
jgi:hypothetical protein